MKAYAMLEQSTRIDSIVVSFAILVGLARVQSQSPTDAKYTFFDTTNPAFLNCPVGDGCTFPQQAWSFSGDESSIDYSVLSCEDSSCTSYCDTSCKCLTTVNDENIPCPPAAPVPTDAPAVVPTVPTEAPYTGPPAFLGGVTFDTTDGAVLVCPNDENQCVTDRLQQGWSFSTTSKETTYMVTRCASNTCNIYCGINCTCTTTINDEAVSCTSDLPPGNATGTIGPDLSPTTAPNTLSPSSIPSNATTMAPSTTTLPTASSLVNQKVVTTVPAEANNTMAMSPYSTTAPQPLTDAKYTFFDTTNPAFLNCPVGDGCTFPQQAWSFSGDESSIDYSVLSCEDSSCTSYCDTSCKCLTTVNDENVPCPPAAPVPTDAPAVVPTVPTEAPYTGPPAFLGGVTFDTTDGAVLVCPNDENQCITDRLQQGWSFSTTSKETTYVVTPCASNTCNIYCGINCTCTTTINDEAVPCSSDLPPGNVTATLGPDLSPTTAPNTLAPTSMLSNATTVAPITSTPPTDSSLGNQTAFTMVTAEANDTMTTSPSGAQATPAPTMGGDGPSPATPTPTLASTLASTHVSTPNSSAVDWTKVEWADSISAGKHVVTDRTTLIACVIACAWDWMGA